MTAPDPLLVNETVPGGLIDVIAEMSVTVAVHSIALFRTIVDPTHLTTVLVFKLLTCEGGVHHWFTLLGSNFETFCVMAC